MKTYKTEIIFILDRSGSMSGLESDTIGGFNGMIEKQKKEAGNATITTVLFDDQYELLHDRITLEGISSLTEKDYYVRGTTALLDAIGKTINKISQVQKKTNEASRADKVLFIITTDGHENASTEFTSSKVKEMIKHHKNQLDWEFVFLGANIDAVETAQRFGIEEDRAVNYVPDGIGTQKNYEVMCDFVSDFRSDKKISSSWKSDIEKDYKKRNK